MDKQTALCLLLLPAVLEDLPYQERLRELLRGPAVVAIEPPRWRRTGQAVATTQARRLSKKLPGQPRVVAIFHPEQYLLARSLIGRHPECELWYGAAEQSFGDARLGELHALAVQRAALEFTPNQQPDEPAFRQNAALWDRLEALGVARR